MTKQEAIRILQDFRDNGTYDNDSWEIDTEMNEALDMAIEALSCSESPNRSDTIYRQDAIDVAKQHWYKPDIAGALEELPSAQPERLTDDDFETIRIHLNAYKEKLCNQQRWKEAEDYQRIIDRFMAFASAESERKKGEWDIWRDCEGKSRYVTCNICGYKEFNWYDPNFCPHCGAEMEGEA